MQDVMARYKETGHKNWKDFPSKACFQMNDTHPTIAVAELMRLLIDQEGLDWDEAWSITTQVCWPAHHTMLFVALCMPRAFTKRVCNLHCCMSLVSHRPVLWLPWRLGLSMSAPEQVMSEMNVFMCAATHFVQTESVSVE